MLNTDNVENNSAKIGDQDPNITMNIVGTKDL